MRNIWWGAGLASISVPGLGTAAIAGGTNAPRVAQMQAEIIYRHATVDFRLCEGRRGVFREAHVRVTGRSRGDAALTGDATATLRYLWSDETGDGFQRGTLVFHDRKTGEATAEADFVDASSAEIAQGTLVGSVRGGERAFIANWRTTWHDNGAVTAQIGGNAADGRLAAVTVAGHCTGPFRRLEEDFPPPPDGDLARTRPSKGRVAWLRQ